MEKEEKYCLFVKKFTDSSFYHANPSCYSWINLAIIPPKIPANFIQVIIMVRPSKAGITCDEVTADYREGVSVINNLMYVDDTEKEKAINELRKIFFS